MNVGGKRINTQIAIKQWLHAEVDNYSLLSAFMTSHFVSCELCAAGGIALKPNHSELQALKMCISPEKKKHKKPRELFLFYGHFSATINARVVLSVGMKEREQKTP